VVSPEITSAHLEWRDRDCHFIFGDTCTAVLVQRADDVEGRRSWEVLGTRWPRSTATTSATTSAS
jgi:beta-ketodecanoyl-[acyl-carrier-protein] synthase